MVIKNKQKINTKGQSLFEIIFAITISAIVLVGILSVAAFSVRNATFSRNKSLANKYAQEVGEWLKQQKSNASSWDAFYDIALPSQPDPDSWCFVTLSWNFHRTCTETTDYISGLFLRNVTVSDQDSGKGLQFTVTVTWTDQIGIHTTETTTVLTNW